MGLKLEWTAFEDGGGAFARVAGFRLTAGARGAWAVDGTERAAGFAESQDAAQEAAEAAAARLLAEDAGVRALLGLRWIPVTEGLPEIRERVYPLATMRVSDTVLTFDESTGRVKLLSLWPGRLPSDPPRWGINESVTHWRPLGAGPAAATSADSANLAATAEEVES